MGMHISSQVKKTTDISTERLVHVDKRPRTASPHFTVSKISVPKTEHGYEASIAGSAIATLQKELSATSSTQKITKSVKAPTVKPGETRVRAEPTPSPQFPFADMPPPDTYKSQAGIEVKKEVGVSISGSTVREEHFEVLRGREAKVTETARVPAPAEVPVTPPTLVSGLKNVTVIEGESVTLECHISGYPSPKVTWYREDYQIESSIDFQITFQGGIARLMIREAFAEDSGRFTCSAVNEAGTVSTSCYLAVQVSEEFDKETTLTEKFATEEKRFVESRDVVMTDTSITEEQAGPGEIQAYRALNQALGRCIRHKNDWGALILVDDRFNNNPNRYISGLSKWVRQQIQHHSSFASALESLTEFSRRHQKVTNRSKKDEKCTKDNEPTLEVACLEDSTFTSVSESSHQSPENSTEEAEVCVQELQCPQVATKSPSVASHGVSRRKKSDPGLRGESLQTMKTEKNEISRSSSPTFGKQTEPVNWPIFNSLRRHFNSKVKNCTPVLKSSKNRAPGSSTFNKTALPLTGNCVPSNETADTSLGPCLQSEVIISPVKIEATPATNYSKQVFCCEKDLLPDTELSPGTEEAKCPSSNKAAETEVDDDSECFTPELFDPVDTNEENGELVETDRSSHSSDCFSAEELFETATGFGQK